MSAPVARRSLLAAAGAAGLARFAAAAETRPLTIGVLTEMGGTYAEDSGAGSVVAARLAVADYHAQGGTLPVAIMAGDAQTKPDVASALARSWYDRDGVDMVLDVPVSNCALAVAQVAQERNKAAVFNTSTSELTGRRCAATHVQWAYDTYALAGSTTRALLAEGGKTWFLIQADYTFGATLAAEARAVIEAGGGRVLGVTKHPFPGTTDFSSFLLQAQASGAEVVGLANAGTDAANCLKQAGEFGITGSGTRLATLQCLLPQIRGVGLAAAQGLFNTEAFYWDMNDGTRAFSERWERDVPGMKPSMIHAGCYAGTLHYLRAVSSIGLEAARADGAAAIAAMKRLPTDDPLFGRGRVREDGRTIHDVFLFRVKAPAASRGPWDIYELVQTTPGEQAFRPIAGGGCPLVKS